MTSSRLFIVWLLTLPFVSPAKDEFVIVLTCYAGFEDRIVSNRAARQGLKTIVVTNILKEEAEELRKNGPNETWLLHEGDHLEDMAPFVAYQHLNDTFKWMFVGEDDTLFFKEGAQTAVKDAKEDVLYMIADSAWFLNHEFHRHYYKSEAPRCVPCGYSKPMDKLPKHFSKACPCKVEGELPNGFCGPHKMPSMDYSPHGGPGFLLSVGLLREISYASMKECFQGGGTTLIACLWERGFAMTDPDPMWHPERLTFFDPMPAPFLTHENIMEKTAYVLGKLLRQVTGMCTDICKDEMSHLVSVHLNAARIGFTRSGEKRIGDFKDPGQREFVGQLIMRAIARFYGREVAGFSAGKGNFVDGKDTDLEKKADERLLAAKRMVQGMGGVFQDDMLGEGEVDRSSDSSAALSTAERVRTAAAMAVARQALDIIIQDATDGTVV